MPVLQGIAFPMTLLIIPILSLISVIHGSETVIFDEIVSDNSVSFDASDVLTRARQENKSVQLTVISDKPIMYRLRKCNKVLFSSQEPALKQKLKFNDDWINWFLNASRTVCKDRKEADKQFEMDLLTKTVSSGAIDFKLIDKIDARSNAFPPQIATVYYVDSQPLETTVYNCSIALLFTEVISSNKTLYLVTDLSTPAKVQFAKCGIVIPESLYTKGHEEIEMSNSLMASIGRIAGLECTSDPTQNRFEIRLTTFKHGIGAFTIRLGIDVPLGEKQLYTGLALLFFFAIVSILVLIVVCLCKCCSKKKKTQMKIYQDYYMMQEFSNRCDTCGESNGPSHA